MPSLEDFDRYVTEHGIPEEHYPAAFALWLAEVTGGPVPRLEKVKREAPADGVVIEGDDLQTEGKAVRFYGVIDPRLEEAVELFIRREDAERVLRDWDRDEPQQAGLLSVEAVELETSSN